ncbi:MAG: 2Fe-2S iron-sulfur cluster binding domain-containing protein [Candidatus Latescibacteria bacterium]|jgi:[NiFe] hydrogenase diaphorase moiety small subunit|nr:2Fe-2S iron-sulfur cluster binding domain-containing protein [Candidatus Latescibacterota bacterium]
MNNEVIFTIDGVDVSAEKGQSILKAAEAAGIYIPHLCAHKDLIPHGSCRVCTVLINGRPHSACTQPVSPGIIVDSECEEVNNIRKTIIEMLFVEGNHFCMFCEKSGNCELQALAYRFGIFAPTLPYLFPDRELDASHPEFFIDGNRCILCARCVRASRDIDGKNVFQFVGRGINKKVTVNSSSGLSDTDMNKADKAADICPVGAIIKKRVGFAVPIGKRLYDQKPIGSDIENKERSNG